MSEPTHAREGVTRARTYELPVEYCRRRWGKVVTPWREERNERGELVDRFGRTAARCRSDARSMTQAADVLAELVRLIEALATPGREWGDAFWRRFDANIGALQTVAARDNYFAAELGRAEADEAASSR